MEQRRDEIIEIIEVLHSPKISKRRPKDLQSKKTLKLVTPIAPTGFDSPQERASHKRQQAGLDQTQSYLQVRQYNVRWIFGCATIWRSPASHSSLTPNQGPNFKPFLIQYSLAKQIGENHFSTFSHDSSQHIP